MLISTETRWGRQSLIPGKETHDMSLRRLGLGEGNQHGVPGKPRRGCDNRQYAQGHSQIRHRARASPPRDKITEPLSKGSHSLAPPQMLPVSRTQHPTRQQGSHGQLYLLMPSGALTMHITVSPGPGLEQNMNKRLQNLCVAKTCLPGTCPLWSYCCPPQPPKRNQIHLDSVFQKGNML